MAKKATRLAGGCLCGAVRWVVTARPSPVVNCHCGQCRRWHGHHGAYTTAARTAVRFTRDGGLAWYQSSAEARRGFCRVCGSSLFWEKIGGVHLDVIAGALDQSIYAIAPSGNMAWQYRTSAPISVPMSCFSGRVYATVTDSNNDSGLLCLDSASGKRVWFTKGVNGTVIATRGSTLLVRTSSGITTIDAKRGDVLERIALPGVRSITPDTAADGNLYVASDSGVIVKFVPKQ